MTTPVQQEILHMLEALSKCCPEVRFGQLVANLSYLAKGPTNEAIWDVEDGEFLAAARKHLAERLGKQSSATESALMEFRPYDFDYLNETDIREEIVSPLLRLLNYRSGTENNIIREQSLNYPCAFLGRKKRTDPLLRGRADYICEVRNKVRWVIEAKAPDASLDMDAIEQAWTYANHPEIRAVYFCLTNGREFIVFQTNHGPEAPPIFQCRYEKLEESLGILRNLLGPESIMRDHPTHEVGEPIGLGLRSIVRITNGSITYESNTLGIRPLIGLTTSVTEGSVERNAYGQLEAYLETLVPFQSLQKLNQKLGLHTIQVTSEDGVISSDASKPTIFSGESKHILPQGEMALDLNSWSEAPLPMNILVCTKTIASGVLSDHVFCGHFQAILNYMTTGLNIDLKGTFRMHLA